MSNQQETKKIISIQRKPKVDPNYFESIDFVENEQLDTPIPIQAPEPKDVPVSVVAKDIATIPEPKTTEPKFTTPIEVNLFKPNVKKVIKKKKNVDNSIYDNIIQGGSSSSSGVKSRTDVGDRDIEEDIYALQPPPVKSGSAVLGKGKGGLQRKKRGL